MTRMNAHVGLASFLNMNQAISLIHKKHLILDTEIEYFLLISFKCISVVNCYTSDFIAAFSRDVYLAY